MKTIEEMRAHVLEKVAAEESFRAELLADTRGTLEQEFGIEIPESVSVSVHEDGPSSFHLVLPPTGELGMDDLESVHGGESRGLDTMYGRI